MEPAAAPAQELPLTALPPSPLLPPLNVEGEEGMLAGVLRGDAAAVRAALRAAAGGGGGGSGCTPPPALLVKAFTWNMHGTVRGGERMGAAGAVAFLSHCVISPLHRPPPPPHTPPSTGSQAGPPDARVLLAGAHAYHIVAVGTQECGRSAAASVLPALPGLPALCGGGGGTVGGSSPHPCTAWEAAVAAGLGGAYYHVASASVGAIHLTVYALRSLKPHVTDIQTGAVPCGLGRVAGNKGGVAVGCAVGGTSLVFVNAHLAAHAHAVGARNRDAARIDAGLPLVPASARVGGQARARVAAHVRRLAAAVGDLRRERARAEAAAAAAGGAAGGRGGGRFASLARAAWASLLSPPRPPPSTQGHGGGGDHQPRPPALSAPAAATGDAVASALTTTTTTRDGGRRARRGLSSFLFGSLHGGDSGGKEDGVSSDGVAVSSVAAASSESARSLSPAGGSSDEKPAANICGSDGGPNGGDASTQHRRPSLPTRASSSPAPPPLQAPLPQPPRPHRRALTAGGCAGGSTTSGSAWGSFSSRLFRTSARVAPANVAAAAVQQQKQDDRQRLLLCAPAAGSSSRRSGCDDVTGGDDGSGGCSAGTGSATSTAGGNGGLDADDDDDGDSSSSDDDDDSDDCDHDATACEGDAAAAVVVGAAPAPATAAAADCHRRHVGSSASGFGSDLTAVRVPTAAAREQQAAASDELLLGVLSALLRSLRVPESLTARYDRVVWMGDLNYRLMPPVATAPQSPPTGATERGDVTGDGAAGAGASYGRADAHHHHAMLAAGDLPRLLLLDQLTAERAAGRTFAGFEEPSLRFAPT